MWRVVVVVMVGVTVTMTVPSVTGGGGRPNINSSRPYIGSRRTNVGGGRTNIGGGRSNVGGGRPNIGGSRPNIGGSRPNIGSGRPNIGSGRPNIGVGRSNSGSGGPSNSGDGPSSSGGRQPRGNLCVQDPRDCDGIGVNHLPIGKTLSYTLQGWWNLQLDSSGLSPLKSSRKVTLEGLASITRESQCRVRVAVRNLSFSDWQRDEAEVVETWLVVSGGSVRAVCGDQESGQQYRGAQRTPHLQSLARSVISASLNMAPNLDHHLTLTEVDHFGQCETHYHLHQTWPGGHEIVRARDLTRCRGSNGSGHFPGTSHISTLTNDAIWKCHHHYQTKGSKLILDKVMCSQSLTLPDVAIFVSTLNLSLMEVHPQEMHFTEDKVNVHELDLDKAVSPSLSIMEHTIRVHRLLDELCAEMNQRMTSKAAITYPRLVSELKYFPKEMIVQLYTEVNTGKFCPNHQRVRNVYLAALRDSTSANVAAAKCYLMTSGTVAFLPSWAASLANVHQPTSESLLTCAGLLEGEHWGASVLGVTSMAGHAARISCESVPHHNCNTLDPRCPQVGERECAQEQAVQVITSRLREKLKLCSSAIDKTEVLLAIQGLGNIGAYGYEAEDALHECGAATSVDASVRVAALSVLGKGPCSIQIMNWLKWEVLNETIETELRITAFQTLYSCNPNEAEEVAALLLKKESDPQVKSYVSAFVREDMATGAAYQFSRHLVANLTALLGLPNTQLETDIVFENSFLPRSIAMNVTSVLLKHFGGSAQFGGRLENLQDLLQSIFGHKGTVGGTLEEFVLALVQKVHELFTSASKEFIKSHERHQRSYSISDVPAILEKVKHEVVTTLSGWVFAGLGGQTRVFSSFTLDPLAHEWDKLISHWLEELLVTSYSSLLQSDVDVTNGWAEIDECGWSWSLLGTPLRLSQQQGGLLSLGASSHVDLLSILTNLRASTLNIALKPSVGVYSLSQLGVSSLTGEVIASSSTQASAGFDVSAVLMIQGGDNMELKVDIPSDSFHGFTAHVTHSLKYPPTTQDSDKDVGDDSDDILYNNNAESHIKCSDEGDVSSATVQGSTSVGEIDNATQHTSMKCVYNTALETALGIRYQTNTAWSRGQQVAVVRSQSFLRKSDTDIAAYKMVFSWKNPGVNSVFLDVHIETEGLSSEKKAGLVFGFTYSPHFTLKLQFLSQQFSAFAETSLVNDPNLKRIEGHIGFGRHVYGLKAELLMVQDGGHVSVKPRLVIAYPGQQEDALLEGYVARYLSDKVTSVTLDLYTEGTLSKYFDVTLKGTIEIKHAPDTDKIITLKNVHFSTDHFSLGLEAVCSLKDNAVEGKIQATLDGQVIMMDGSITNLGSGKEDQHYRVYFEVLLPDHPQLDTRILSITQVYTSEVTNNLTLTIGPEAARREFQVTHSASWSIAKTKALLTDVSEEHFPHYSPYSGVTARVVNKLYIISSNADFEWNIDHKLQLTDRSLENLILAKIGEESHKIMGNFYDQSEQLFKYHTELEISLPAWHFSYVDTLQQNEGGDMIGQSTTIMPSGRIYTSFSRYFKSTMNNTVIFEFSYDILVRDGLQTWKILAQEVFVWSPTQISLQATVSEGELAVFGLETSLEGLNTQETGFFFKNWIRELYECEASLSNKGHKTDFSLTLFIIPLNREIKSKFALDHDSCTGGSVDGELAWDAREDASRTLTFSSLLHLPRDGRALEIRLLLSVLTWTWESELKVVLGRKVGDVHWISYILLLPDNSKFEIGSQLGFSVEENNFDLLTGFEIHLPSGETHNVSVVAGGYLIGNNLANANLTLTVESPITEDIHFHLHFKNERSDGQSDVGMMLKAYSEANYWDALDVKTTGSWDGTTMNVEVEGSLANITLNLDGTGSYWLVQDEHRLTGSVELRIPSSMSWKHLKSSINGTFSVSHSPGRLKVSHVMIVEKDKQVIFSCNGKVLVDAQKVEGRLRLDHAGPVGSSQVYTLDGIFTGKELKLHVKGTVDSIPLKILLHYIDGRQVTVDAIYWEDGHFSLSITTQLKNISIGIRKGNGTYYSLTTEGQVMYKGQRTKMHHQLAITPSEASSVLRLSPFLGNVFMLTTNRTKMALNHWDTDVVLNWGERIFTYHDEISIPSFTDWFVKVEINAPYLYMQDVKTEVETVDEGNGQQAVQLMFQEDSIILHKARLAFYKYDTVEEKVWRASASNVIVSAQPYNDLIISHAIILPTNGMEIKSNMTVGDTPVIGVGVKVTPQTRALIFSVCTTIDECVCLDAHTHAQTTPSTRTYSLAAHALNSLFWHGSEDLMVQNSITFMAEETSEMVVVSGGIRRVECEQVTCKNFVTQGLLHATIHVTEDAFDFLVDTSNRTIKLRTVVRGSQKEETSTATLPGGRLVDASTVETHLWMDQASDPNGVINWNSTIAHYASSRASEWAVQSTLHHRSFNKILRVSGNVVVIPTSASAVLLLDVFTNTNDVLRVDMELLQEHGNYELIANLSKTTGTMPRIMDVVVSFLPSPDSGSISVLLIVPSMKTRHTVDTSSVTHQVLERQFSFTCGMDVTHRYTMLSCKLKTPSVHEKVFVRYQVSHDPECKSFRASLGIFNHTYYTKETACYSPLILQATLSKNSQGGFKDELALKFGLVDVRTAEIDLLGTIHVKLQLYPPFLLHAMAYTATSMWSRWRDIMHQAQDEINTLTLSAKTVVQAVAADVIVKADLLQVSISTPASFLADYLQGQTHHLLLEMKEDQLLLDIAHGAQACCDVTGVIIEAAIAYLTHNYGQVFTNMMAGVQVWLKSATVTTGAWLTHMGQRVANALTSTASFITFLPEILYNYVLTVPVVGNFTQWIATHVRCFQKSTTFIFIRETIISAGQVLHKVISLLYSDEGNVYSQVAGGGVWNVYIPLPECGHSLFDVWHYVGGSSHPSWHQVLLSSAVYRWWHLLTHPAQLIHYFTPPFRAQGAIIGNTHFLSLDGRIFSLSSSCAHVLITDARDGLFTLISNWNHTLRGRDYLLVLGNVTLKLAPDLQVIIDDTPVSLPYIRRMVSVKRDVHHLVMTAKDPLERDMITLTCWTSQHACIVSISGWFHAHTRGLLGNLNLDPSDDFMRPSGKMAVSKGIFSESWHLGSQCFPEKAETEIPPSSQQKVLCYKFLLHYASPVFSCHEAVNVMPFFDTCNQHLASLQHKLNQTKADIHVDITRGVVAAVNTSSFMYSTAQGSDSELLVDVNKSKNASVYHITPDKISVLNILFPFTRDQDDIVDASMEEVAALCDVMAAYSTVCSEQDINFALPQLCGGESLLTYQEPLSPVQQLDLLMLVNEDKCDSFIYQHLIRPLPSVLERIAHGKNLSDIYIGVLGYGSGSGDVMYHTFGASFLTSVSQFRITQPWNNERAQGSLLQGLRAVSTFPFRPGSVRIAFVVSCDNQDLPKFTETLPREMVQRRLSLFTLTPELLLFSPGRPKAVRNTVGMDRWRVYNLRLDSQETHDLRVRRPDSNIAQLALKSGGGVFSITALREDDRAAYYMKLFRRVLSRAFVKVVSNAYKQQRASSVN